MNTQTEQILAKANDLREAEQFGEASKLYTDCLVELINGNDHEGLIHCLSGQSLIYKILARRHDNLVYRHLAIAFSKEAFDIAKQHKDTLDGRSLSIAYSSYADTLLEDKQYEQALPLFEESLSVSIADIPEKGRIKAHIGRVKYLLGEKETGTNLIKEGLNDIRTGDLSAYHIRVWETGAMNALVKILQYENKIDEAKKLADDSLKIATEHQLKIRKKEVEEIISNLL